jgi:hypothetical protein
MVARLVSPFVNVPRCGAVAAACWVAAILNSAELGTAHAAEPVASAQPVPANAVPAKAASEKPASEQPAPEKLAPAKTTPDKTTPDKAEVGTPVPEKPAAEKATAEKAVTEKPKAAVTPGVGELSTTDRALLNDLLTQAGASAATVRSMERSPERQVAVMLRLAQEDLVKAKAMYCSLGDRVLERFDATASVEKNQAAMLEALVAVLPQAREAGCLNHIRNSDVLSLDVAAADVPEGQRATLVKAAEAAVSAGKIARFLAPPREPDAFHFEFKRRSE